MGKVYVYSSFELANFDRTLYMERAMAVKPEDRKIVQSVDRYLHDLAKSVDQFAQSVDKGQIKPPSDRQEAKG